MKFISFTAFTNEELDSKINNFLKSNEIKIINFTFTVSSGTPHVAILYIESPIKAEI